MTLAKVFNIAINDLLADEGAPEAVADGGMKSNFIYNKKNTSHIYELSSSEKILVGIFRSCSPEEQEQILANLKERCHKKMIENQQS